MIFQNIYIISEKLFFKSPLKTAATTRATPEVVHPHSSSAIDTRAQGNARAHMTVSRARAAADQWQVNRR
jgi:hypothetical protein